MTRVHPAPWARLGVLGSLLAAIPTAAVLPSEAQACSCEAVDLERSFAASELVFEADVVALVERPGHELRATLAVTRVWKGEPGARIVYDGPDDNTCGMNFADGLHYVVYGSHDRGLLSTSYCNGTSTGEPSRTAIAWLEEHATPRAAPAEPPSTHAPAASAPTFASPSAFPDAERTAPARARGCAATDTRAPLAPLLVLPLFGARRRARPTRGK